MLGRVVTAVVVGVLVTLACMLVGVILVALKVTLAVTVGNFLQEWAGVFGLLAALWHFFSGDGWNISRP